jgi:phage-related baseplate assembly protein
MVEFKSKNTILGELRTFLRSYARSIDTGDNSLIKDFILTPLSVAGGIIFDQIKTVSNLFLLSQQTSSDLEKEAGNYKIERSLGTNANVDIVFYANTKPTSDVYVPIGTVASTVGTSFVSPVSFTTVADFRIPVSAFEAFYSYDRGRYEFTIPCVASAVGSAGNVGSGTILKLTSSVTGIDGVNNLIASSGGSDQESDEDMRKRVASAKTGRDINTVNGLKAYITGLGFRSAFPVRCEDPDSERPTGIDVFVTDAYILANTETVPYYSTQPRYYLAKSPLREVTSIVSATRGILSPSDYDVYADNISDYRRSSYAQDYFEVRATALLPPTDILTVTYTYNADVNQYQDNLELDVNQVLTADVLLKRAYPMYLYLNATLTLKANADGPNTRTKVRNSIIQFLDTYRLGDDIQKSDLIVVMQNGYGDYPVNSVDAVTINSYYLKDEFGTNYLPVSETVAVNNKQYVVSGSLTVV